MFNKPVTVKTKISIVTFIAILLSISMSSSFIYFYMSPILSNQIVRDNHAIISKITQQVSYCMEDIMNYAKGIALNDQVQGILKEMKVTKGYDYFQSNFKLETILKEYTLLRDNIIVDMFVIDNKGEVLELKDLYTDSLNESWYDDFRFNRNINGFSKKHSLGNRMSLNLSQMNVVSYIINIYDKSNPRIYLGKLVIHLNYDVLVKPMIIDDSLGIKITAFDEYEDVIYSFEENPTIFSSKYKNFLKSEDVILVDDHYYIIEEIPSSKWKVIAVISMDKINANMKFINYVILLISAICLIIMSIIIYPIIINVTKPVTKLIQGMKQVSKGNLDTNIAIQSGDEIEEAALVFNKMVIDIKNFIEELIYMEKKKRKLELKMFMYQINPHFIYNTLNCVIYLARRANAPDIMLLTKSLISFLQKTTRSKPEMFSSIRDEIKHINDYTLILKYMYHDRVEILWEVDESLAECRIPEMILYPLVENSIFHGILPTSEKGWVRISITMEDNTLTVSVEDNGIGINSHEMEILRNKLQSSSISEDTDHIGLLNVNNRLKLLFGEHYHLNLDSMENQGTRVWFSIPCDYSNTKDDIQK